MVINVGVIGAGKRFEKIYCKVLNNLLILKKIKTIVVYNRSIEPLNRIKNFLNCETTQNIDEIIFNKNINLLIVTVPFHLRKKILKKKLYCKKILLETPFSNNLAEYYQLKRNLKKRKIAVEVMEDRFFFKNTKKNYTENIKWIVNNNREWSYHFFGTFFKISNYQHRLLNIKQNLYFAPDLDKFVLNFKNFFIFYIFSTKKTMTLRKKGYIKIKTSNNLQKITKNHNDDKINSVEKCIINFLKSEKDTYFEHYSETESLLITLIKIMKKFKIKKLNEISIYFVKKICNLLSFFY